MIAKPRCGPRIAIIGGGFSGTLALANLVRQADAALSIDLFEQSGNAGTGVAYGTIDIAHLLNVRTDRLGAFPDAPQGFYTWLHDEAGKAQVSKLWPGYEVRPDGYVPRMFYAAYLKHILEESLKLAREKSIDVRVHHASIEDIESGDPLTLSIKKGNMTTAMEADAVVLATGNLPPRRFDFEPAVAGSGRYIADIWSPAWDETIHAVRKLPAKSHILVIGTGLTAIDAILTLEEENYPGTVVAVSRNGRLPAAHMASRPYPAWEWVLHPDRAPRTASALLARLRAEIQSAARQGYDWRSVIDSLRPVTQPLWRQTGLHEKKRFLRRLLPFWNIHRHRMAPEVAAEIAKLQASGKLKIVAGQIRGATKMPHGLAVTWRGRSNAAETVEAALVINCTGPDYDLARCPHPLMARLYKRGIVTPHPLGMGMEVTAAGAAGGEAAIFPIGSLLIGEFFECTAIPELRQQAHAIAGRLLARVAEKTKVAKQAGRSG